MDSMALPLTFMQASEENKDYYLIINIFLSIITLLMIIMVLIVCFCIIWNIFNTTINSYWEKTGPKAEVEPLIV